MLLKVSELQFEESSLDLQLASYLESSNDRTLTNQATDLNEEILTLDARIEKAKDELNAVISQSKEQYAMMDEDYYSTMAEVVRLDNESQQLELLFEKESMETQALKYELTQREKWAPRIVLKITVGLIYAEYARPFVKKKILKHAPSFWRNYWVFFVI